MNKKIIDFLYIFMIVLLIIFMIVTIYLLIHYSEELKSNPFIYGAKKFGNIECNCIQYSEGGTFKNSFAFNTTTLWNNQKIISYDYNLSNSIKIIN